MAKILDLTIGLSVLMQGQPDAKINQAANAIGELQKKISGLTQSTSIISKYQAAGEKLSISSAKLDEHKNALARVSHNIDTLKTRQSQLEQARKKAFTSGDLQKVNAYNREIEKTQKHIAKLEDAHKKLTSQGDRLSSNVKRDSDAFNKLGESMKRAGIDTNNLASTQDRLQAELNQTKQAQENLIQAQSRLQQARQNLSFDNIKGDLLAAYAGLQAWKKPLDVSIDFEAAIARVKSAGIKQFRDNPELVQALRNQAIQLGRDTKFTSSEAALAQEQLIRAGYTAQETINAMPGLLNLAASEDLQIDQAAEIVSKISKAFGYSADQTTRIADVLNNMSVSASTNIPQLYEGIRQVAPLASKAGMQIEDLAAYIAVMQDSAIDSSTSGNALKTGLLRLLSAANKIQGEDKEQKQATLKALQQLGITIMTRDGKVRRIEDLLAEMQQKLSVKGEGERLAILGDIFGKQNVTAWTALMADSASGKTSRFVQSNNTEAGGISEERAQVLLGTTKGQGEIMQSAIQNLLLRVGDNLKPAVDTVQSAVTSITSKISSWMEANPNAGKLATYTGAAASTYGGWAIGSKILEYGRALIGSKVAESAAGSALTSAAGAAGQAITTAGAAAESAVTAGGAAASQTITAGGTAAGGSLMAGAAAISAAVGMIYANYKAWANMTPEQQRQENARVVNSDSAIRRTREINNNAQRMQGGRNRAGFTPHAVGGIFTTPHIGLVAESGAEAIIPLTDKTRGTSLLIQAAEKLGLINNNNNFSRFNSETNNIINREIFNSEREILQNGTGNHDISNIINRRDNNNNLHEFAPVINITVNANENESRDNYSLSELITQKVRNVLDEINNNFARLEYA